MPWKLRHREVSQMAWDKWHGGSCLHPFQSGQQIWKVFLRKHKPHVRSKGAEPNFSCLPGERCEKLREVNVFFFVVVVAQIADYSASVQSLTPRLCSADAGNCADGQPQKSKIKTPFETQNPESWAGQVIPFSKTRWLTLDEYGTPEQLWLKVKMRPDGIYVTESEGGRCSVTLAWSNKGQGGKKIAGCEMEPSRSQQVAELWLQPQIHFSSWGLKVDGGSFLAGKS